MSKMTLRSSHLVAQWVQEKGTQPSQRSREKVDLERANEQLQQLGSRFVRLYLQQFMMVEVNTWVGFSTRGICDRTCWVLTMSESDWSWPCKAKNRTHAQRLLFQQWGELANRPAACFKKGSHKKSKNEPQWFRNLLNESFISIFVLVKAVCCFNQSRFLSLKSNPPTSFRLSNRPFVLLPPWKELLVLRQRAEEARQGRLCGVSFLPTIYSKPLANPG